MWISSRRPFLDGLLQLQDYSAPAYQLLLRLVAGGEQPPEWRLRLPAALFGVLAVPAGAWCARLCFGRAVGLMTGLVLALDPTLVGYAREARPNSLFVLLSALSVGCCHRLVTRGGRGDALAWAASALLLAHSHYMGWLCLAAQAAWAAADALVRRPPAAELRLRIGAGAAVLALSLPSLWLASRFVLSGAPATLGWIPRHDVGSFGSLAAFLLGWWRQPPGALGAALGLAATALALLSPWRASAPAGAAPGWPRRRGAVLTSLWLAFALLAFLPLQSLYRPLLEPRYALPAAIPLAAGALGTAQGLHPAAGAGLAALLAASSASALPRIGAPAPGLRELTAWVERSVPAGGALYVLDWSYTGGFVNPEREGLAYYGLRERELRLLDARPEARGAAADALAAAGPGPHVVVGFVLPARRVHTQLVERGWSVEAQAFGLSQALVVRR
jgi:4-amino-4-deoxy-L-arabinose transferase-like glycosyltransferase